MTHTSIRGLSLSQKGNGGWPGVVVELDPEDGPSKLRLGGGTRVTDSDTLWEHASLMSCGPGVL